MQSSRPFRFVLGALEDSVATATGEPQAQAHVALFRKGETIVHDDHAPAATLDGYLEAVGDILSKMGKHVHGLCLRAAVMLPSGVTEEAIEEAHFYIFGSPNRENA